MFKTRAALYLTQSWHAIKWPLDRVTSTRVNLLVTTLHVTCSKVSQWVTTAKCRTAELNEVSLEWRQLRMALALLNGISIIFIRLLHCFHHYSGLHCISPRCRQFSQSLQQPSTNRNRLINCFTSVSKSLQLRITS